MTWVLAVNDNPCYRAPDGREAWVLYGSNDGYACIVTDIHGKGQPYNAVHFDSATLREIADEIDRRKASSEAP